MRFALLLSALLLASAAARGEILLVEASQDATLVEHADGALANGAGPALFAGRTNQAIDAVRRAVLRFEAPQALSRSAIVVERVALVLQVLPGNDGPGELRVHRVLAPWSEGDSSSSGGGGAPSVDGDATWVHASYPDLFWLHNGGQFEGTPLGSIHLESRGLTRAIAGWIARPEANFGLLLIGNETARQTVRAIGSREHPDPAFRPALEITYRTAR